MSFGSRDDRTTRIKEFVSYIINNDNDKVLAEFFKTVHEQEIKEDIFDFFDNVRMDYNNQEKNREVFVHKLDRETYVIEMSGTKYPILVYRFCFSLKIRSISPLKKGETIIGWVQSNVKFKDNRE
jgi:hypothetical protein